MTFYTRMISIIAIFGLLQACSQSSAETQPVKSKAAAAGSAETESLKEIAYDAYIYAYPMMEQVKTINAMEKFYNLEPNKVTMNPKLPWESVGMPIVAPNLTSMTGAVFMDITHGPVTLEIPEVKDRYIVYQAIDVFTHNFFYLGTRANNGEAGRFVFYNSSQEIPNTDATPVRVEGNYVMIVNRIDIKNAEEADHVRGIQQAIKIIDAPEKVSNYPEYDAKRAYNYGFVKYVNKLLSEVPPSETEQFKRFAAIGIMSDVELTKEQKAEVQAGIDAAVMSIKAETKNLQIGNGYTGATEIFGTREFLNGNYIGRAAGAYFGLWGNSKEEANYYMTTVAGEGEIVFSKDELPPLSDVGFWSVTAHDKNVHVNKNKFDKGYVLTMDQMKFEEDGSLRITFSNKAQDHNWLYTEGDTMIILIRVYQPDSTKIADYTPPPFKTRTY